MLMFVVAMASAITSAQTKIKMTDEQTLIALDKEWTAAELRLNTDDQKTITRIVAEDYTGTTPFGQIENKAQYMAALKATPDTDVADEYVVHFLTGRTGRRLRAFSRKPHRKPPASVKPNVGMCSLPIRTSK